jgi:group I intron endonuclease
MIVYLLRNKVNDKCYVGKTMKTLKVRRRQHRTEARIGRYDWPLYRDIRDFGAENFSVELLGKADSNRRISQMERNFIRQFNTVSDGYNQACASFGGRIRKAACSERSPLSEEHRERIADSVRRYWKERKAQNV